MTVAFPRIPDDVENVREIYRWARSVADWARTITPGTSNGNGGGGSFTPPGYTVPPQTIPPPNTAAGTIQNFSDKMLQPGLIYGIGDASLDIERSVSPTTAANLVRPEIACYEPIAPAAFFTPANGFVIRLFVADTETVTFPATWVSRQCWLTASESQPGFVTLGTNFQTPPTRKYYIGQLWGRKGTDGRIPIVVPYAWSELT